jgi:hypothetical protein
LVGGDEGMVFELTPGNPLQDVESKSIKNARKSSIFLIKIVLFILWQRLLIPNALAVSCAT